jgi:hypothetical protein
LIAQNKDDQIKTSFITPFGAYCYMTMSFGLKNAGATYQHAIQECLEKEIQADLVEAYVDNVVVKTKESHSLIDDLTRTFTALNQYQCKLNPKKCIFGVPSGILLGNVIGHNGIHPNPEKVQSVLLKPSIKQEDDPVIEKPPDQPLVAMVPSTTTTEPSPTTAGPSQTLTKIAD